MTVLAWALLPVLVLSAVLVLLAVVDAQYPRSLPRRPLPFPRRLQPLVHWSNLEKLLVSPVWPYLRESALKSRNGKAPEESSGA